MIRLHSDIDTGNVFAFERPPPIEALSWNEQLATMQFSDIKGQHIIRCSFPALPAATISAHIDTFYLNHF